MTSITAADAQLYYNKVMNCPVCEQKMKKIRWDISNNPKDSKEYDRTTYRCETDDVWVQMEVPRDTSK